MKIDEQIIHTTIRIVSSRSDGLISTGTGFFYQFDINGKQIPVIVTNKHVLEKSMRLVLKFSVDANGVFVPGEEQIVNIDSPLSFIINHPKEDIDLCIIKISSIFNLKLTKKLHVIYLTKENVITDEYINNNVSNIEDVTIIGYPDGLIDYYNNLPIVRKGITATSLKYDFNNKKEFLIDSSIYNGSSGSPVFIYNQGLYSIGNSAYVGDRCFLVGIVYEVYEHKVNGKIKINEIPDINLPVTETKIPNNLGRVIKACELFEFEKILESLLTSVWFLAK